MAKKYFKVTKQFTRSVNRTLVVGHPEHRDPNGRFLALEEGPDTDRLIEEKRVEPISEAAYRKALDDARQDAGEARVTKTETGVAKLSATASDVQIRARADEVGADLSKAKTRHERIKAVNAKIEEGAEASTADDDRSNSVNSTVADLTERSTLQPPAPAVLGTEPIVNAEDAAPTSGEGNGNGKDGDGKDGASGQ